MTYNLRYLQEIKYPQKHDIDDCYPQNHDIDDCNALLYVYFIFFPGQESDKTI